MKKVGKRVFSLRKLKVALFVFAMLFAVFGGMLGAKRAFGTDYTELEQGELKRFGDCILQYSQYNIAKSYTFKYTSRLGNNFDITLNDKLVSTNDGVSFGCMLYAIWGPPAGMLWVSWEEKTQSTTSEIKNVSDLSSEIDIYLSGSSIGGGQGAEDIYVKSTNGNFEVSFDDYLYRPSACKYKNGVAIGEDGCGIASIGAKIKVSEFIYNAEHYGSVSDGCDDGGCYREYTIEVEVYRKNANNTSSGFGRQEVSLRVKKDEPAPEPEHRYYYAETNYNVTGENQKHKGSPSTGWSNNDKESIAHNVENAGVTYIAVGEYATITFSHRVGYSSDGKMAHYGDNIATNGENVGESLSAKWNIGRSHNINGRTSNALVSENVFEGSNYNYDGYVIERACIGTFQNQNGDLDDSTLCDGQNRGEGKAQEVKKIFISPNSGEGNDAYRISNNYVGPFHERKNDITTLAKENYEDIEIGNDACLRKNSVAGLELYYTDYTADALKCSRRRFNARDVYRIRFNKAGEYYFCESITVEDANNTGLGKATTTGCVKVVVDGVTVKINTDEVFAGETANVEHSFKFRGIEGEKAKVIAYASNDDESGKEAKKIRDDVSCQNAGFSVFGGECKEGDLKEVFKNSSTAVMNVFDVSAGKYYCVAVAFSPFNSNDSSWYVSKPDCKKIGKKPSLQVWGAGMYTAGDIALNNAEKRVVDGFYGFTLKDQSNTTVFGTWVEQNIIANGKINIASGAATGRKGNDFGGSREGTNINVCVRSPLTMPNKDCSQISNPGSLNSMNKPNDKEKLINKLDNKCEWRESSLNGASVGNGESRFYCSNNDFNISGDIVYADNYSLVSEIPKVIIYSKKNIVVGCGVRRIDAVLIAEGNVYTCDKEGVSNGVDASKRSNQLKINGAVIANKMIAGRTYGAATGVNSGTPAEIINYDTSLYLWGSSRSDVTKTGKLKVVYQTELAPRL